MESKDCYYVFWEGVPNRVVTLAEVQEVCSEVYPGMKATSLVRPMTLVAAFAYYAANISMDVCWAHVMKNEFIVEVGIDGPKVHVTSPSTTFVARIVQERLPLAADTEASAENKTRAIDFVEKAREFYLKGPIDPYAWSQSLKRILRRSGIEWEPVGKGVGTYRIPKEAPPSASYVLPLLRKLGDLLGTPLRVLEEISSEAS